MTENQNKPASNLPPVGFNVVAQYIRDMSFEGPAHPADVQVNEAPKIDVNVTANTRPLEGNAFEVMLNVRAQATVAGKNAFLIELSYAGLVQTPPGTPDETLKYLLLAEVPRYLFPFARSIVANATREGGFPPLLLQPIDFHALYQKQLKHAEAAPSVGNA
jgi:preprotein translocase subunit SecB